MAEALDEMVYKLTGVKEFTKEEGLVSARKIILAKLLAHAKQIGWRLEGWSTEETTHHLETLIEFCERAHRKRLRIRSWA
jgi:hypothetical protein